MATSGREKTRKELIAEIAALKSRVASLEAEAVRNEGDNRYRTLLRDLPDAVQIVCKGVLVYVNDAAVELFAARSPEDLIGRMADDFLCELETGGLEPESNGVRRRVPARREESVRMTVAGDRIDVLVSDLELDWNGQPAVLSVLHDNRAVVRARNELLMAREAAELANRTKSAFLADMSHEIRTPLNAIIGFADVMKQEMFGPLGSERYREYGGDIVDSGHHLQSLINDILDLSKLEAGRMELNADRVDIARVIDSSLAVLKTRAAAGGIKLAVRVARKLPALRGDERRIRQVLFNLLSNASKFTPDGGRISVSAVAREKTGLRISVVDTGVGMHEKDLVTALTPFGQVASEGFEDVASQGTGLGLPLARSLVEKHGGTLDLKSRPGKGTRVTLHFPRMRLVA